LLTLKKFIELPFLTFLALMLAYVAQGRVEVTHLTTMMTVPLVQSFAVISSGIYFTARTAAASPTADRRSSK